jgi:hypothetical protein
MSTQYFDLNAERKQPNRVHHAYEDTLFDELAWGMTRVPFLRPAFATKVYLLNLRASGTLFEKRAAILDVALNMPFETSVEFREDPARGMYARITRMR